MLNSLESHFNFAIVVY